jgi:hypothetical protein
MSKLKLSITLDHAVADKLPPKDRSNFINRILREYFMKENLDALMTEFKRNVLKDKEFLAKLDKAINDKCEKHPNQKRASCPFTHGVVE